MLDVWNSQRFSASVCHNKTPTKLDQFMAWSQLENKQIHLRLRHKRGKESLATFQTKEGPEQISKQETEANQQQVWRLHKIIRQNKGCCSLIIIPGIQNQVPQTKIKLHLVIVSPPQGAKAHVVYVGVFFALNLWNLILNTRYSFLSIPGIQAHWSQQHGDRCELGK